MFLLAADDAGRARRLGCRRTAPAADWRTLPLRPGALFVVGDPKQSIYRFRRADIDIYNIVRARFSDPAIGRVLPLTMNFRSVPALCDWANEVFKTRFPAEPTTHSPRFAALDPNDGGQHVRRRLHADARVRAEARSSSRTPTGSRRYIRSEVDAERRTFSDFLILTRKKRDRIVPYARGARSAEHPDRGERRRRVRRVGGGRSADGAAARARRSAGCPVARRRAARPAVRHQRSASCSRSSRPAAGSALRARRIRATCRRRTPSAAAATRCAGTPRRSRALRQYYRWTRLLPAAAALDRILEHTGYLALAATTPGGVEAGDLLHAVDRVRQVVEEGGSLADAAERSRPTARRRTRSSRSRSSPAAPTSSGS